MLKNSLKLAAIFIGAVIGAGFATGREIISYFMVYGQKWSLGIMFAGVVLFVSSFIVMELVRKNNITSENQFFNYIFGNKFGWFFQLITILFVITLFLAMVSAFGYTINDFFKVNTKLACSIFLVFSAIVILPGLKSIVIINSILSSLILIGGFLTGAFIIFFDAKSVMLLNGSLWISAAIYSAYNFITLVPVFINSKELLLNTKISFLAAFLGSLVICLMGIGVGIMVYKYLPHVIDLEIPMVYIAKQYGHILNVIYILVIICAIITTSAGNSYAAACALADFLNIKYITAVIFIFVFGVIGCFIPFSVFVNKAYWIFGLFGVFEIICIIFRFLKEKLINF